MTDSRCGLLDRSGRETLASKLFPHVYRRCSNVAASVSSRTQPPRVTAAHERTAMTLRPLATIMWTMIALHTICIIHFLMAVFGQLYEAITAPIEIVFIPVLFAVAYALYQQSAWVAGGRRGAGATRCRCKKGIA